MHIVDSNTFFTLISVILGNTSDSIEIELERNPFVPREFNPEAYKRYKLTLYGVIQAKALTAGLRKFIGDYADVDEIEAKTLDFWSGDYQIGEFEFDHYLEEVKNFTLEDWISEHERLIGYFYAQSDDFSTRSNAWSTFINGLELYARKQIKNLTVKNEFLNANNQQKSAKANEKVIEFAKRIMRMIDEYKGAKEPR